VYVEGESERRGRRAASWHSRIEDTPASLAVGRPIRTA
jgi:hypothetical protein